MSQGQSSVDVPAIRFFQFESDSLGTFNKSVNLSRGDVNGSLPLFSMPGRQGSSDVEATAILTYQSNISQEVARQNLTAPTGVVGLGWSLPLEKIVLVTNGSLSIAARQYQLQGNNFGGRLVLTSRHDGKEYYQLEDYEFWLICYDPKQEVWEITRDDGITETYGGGVEQTAEGDLTSRGNSIAWGVRYGNWIGATRLTSNKAVQYAREWYLCETRNQWGDAVTYEYNGFERRSDGLIQDVEQLVGDRNGKPYTKAVYLTKMIDVFGRSATFDYKNKEYDTSTPGAPKEYQAAHSYHAATTEPNGFQDVYETKYLNAISVKDADDEVLTELDFQYENLRNLTDYNPDSYEYGVTFKRYLKSVRGTVPGGGGLPGYDFEYYTERNQSGAQLGALAKVAIPSGGIATYEYARQELDIARRKMDIPKPAPEIIGSGSSIPRVWFGEDFVAVTWVNAVNGKLWFGIYTWLGYWKLWCPNDPILFKGVDVASLNAVIAHQSLALTFSDSSRTYMFLYQKDVRQSGAWISYNDRSSAYLSFPSTRVTFLAGTQFMLASREDPVKGEFLLTRITWNWKTRKWITEENVFKSQAPLFVTTGPEYYITIAYDKKTNSNDARLVYLDIDKANLAWQQGGRQTLTDIYPSSTLAQFLGSGTSMAALSVSTRDSRTVLEYEVIVLRWDENYRFLEPYRESFSMQKEDEGAQVVTIFPQVLANTTVVCGENLLRFNGSTWLSNKSLQLTRPSSLHEYWFAHGIDFSLRTVNKGKSGIEVEMLVYDPNNRGESTRWDSTPFSPEPQPDPSVGDARKNGFPSAAGQDFFTCGNRIYYRGSSTNWSTPAKSPIFTIADQINSTSIINQGPNFIAYTVPDDLQPKNAKTVVLELHNGLVKGKGKVLPGRIYSLDHISGKVPAGSGSLITFPATTRLGNMDNADSLTLYRYVDGLIEGKLIHYPVNRIKLCNGFGEESYTSYSFDPKSAAPDPTGRIAKYYRATVYPGSDKPEESLFGKTVNTYINGYNNDIDLTYYLNGQKLVGPFADPGLDGFLLSVEDHDSNGRLVRKGDYTWHIFTLRNRDPKQPDNQPEPLFGSYARQCAITSVLDGVITQTSTNYTPEGFQVPFSGMAISECNSNYNGSGELERFTRAYVYGYEKYPALLARNDLATVVQTTRLVQTDDGTPLPIQAQVDTLEDWGGGKWGPCRSYQWKGGSNTEFPFESGNESPEGWLLAGEITAINGQGLVLGTRNAMGRPDSALYSRNGEFVVAQFQNADLARDEADYYGFEAYETGNGWEMKGNASVITGDSFTGYRSARLEKGGDLGKTYTPGTTQTYIMGYWYKTAPGYTSNSDSGWHVTVEDGVGKKGTKKYEFADTDGTWAFDFFIIDLRDYVPGITLEVTVKNQQNEPVIIDNMRMVPNLSNFSAFVYDNGRALPTVQMGQGTRLERIYYDSFGRSVATAGPYEEQLSAVYLYYMSRQDHGGVFSAKEPNSRVRVEALDGGFCETFTDRNGWKAHWNATNSETHWASGNGRLLHTTAANDTLSLKAPNCRNEFFLAFNLQASDPTQTLDLTDAIGIRVGENNAFIWNPQEKSWSVTVGGLARKPLCTWDGTPLSWGLLFKQHTVMFYANGRLLVSVVSDAELLGDVSLTTGKNQLAFYNLALARSPKTGVVFKDGLSNPRQNQALSNTNAIVTQTVTNPLGKPIVETRPAPARFGDSDETTPLLCYRPNFVEMPAFLEALDASGIMPGEVSTYYNGRNGASDDGGYPYTRTLLERSPLARIIEKGNAGKAYAIIDPWTTDPMTRATIKMAYGNNSIMPVTGVENLPAGAYNVTEQTDQNGTRCWGISNMQGDLLVKAAPAGQKTHVDESGASNLINRMFTTYPDDGRLETQRLPGYFDSEQPDSHRFIIVKRYDPLGNLIERSTPNNGTARALYNSAGKIRFFLDARGAAEGYLVYIKYDVLGRPFEKGILEEAWEPSMLADKVDQPNWPEGRPGQFVQKQLTYTTYVDSINGLGMLAEAMTRGEDGRIVVRETYQYNDGSQAKTVSSAVIDQTGLVNQGEMRYSYTARGKIAQVIYPNEAGCDIGTVCYSYDDLGRMIGVGRSIDEPDTYASYAYAGDGSIAGRALNGGRLPMSFTYHPPGWTASLQEEHTGGFSEALPDYLPNGLIKSVSEVLQGPGFAQNLTLSAEYTPTGQLAEVSYTGDPDWDLAVDTYDGNGNMLQLRGGAHQEQYRYKPGTDQLVTLDIDGKSGMSFEYDAKGGVARACPSATPSGSALTFTYVKGGYLTTGIDLVSDEAKLELYYGAGGKRVLKRYTTRDGVTNKYYLNGGYTRPLMETTEAGVTAYIYGLEGLVAFQKGADRYFLIKDHLGSSRMVYRADNVVMAAWSYSSFGHKKIVYEAHPQLLTYLYCGQEWDAEVGLYNFQARMYDPRSRRFYFTDPKTQFVSAYVFNGNDPLNMMDPTGMWSVGEWFTEIGEILISLAEIVAGIVIDVVSGGAANISSSTLIGAGLEGLTTVLEANLIRGEPPSWEEFGEAQVIGAVTGFVSGNFSKLGGVLTKSTKGVGKVAIEVGVGAASGAATGVTGQAISNGFSGKPFAEGLGRDAWMGAVMGASSATFGQMSGAFTEGLSSTDKTMGFVLGGAFFGFMAGFTNSLFMLAVEGDDFKWQDAVTSITMSTMGGAVDGVTESLKDNRRANQVGAGNQGDRGQSNAGLNMRPELIFNPIQTQIIANDVLK